MPHWSNRAITCIRGMYRRNPPLLLMLGVLTVEAVSLTIPAEPPVPDYPSYAHLQPHVAEPSFRTLGVWTGDTPPLCPHGAGVCVTSDAPSALYVQAIHVVNNIARFGCDVQFREVVE